MKFSRSATGLIDWTGRTWKVKQLVNQAPEKCLAVLHSLREANWKEE